MTDFHQDGRAGIDAALVRRLLAQQFPQWADLPVTPVKVDGWDNRTYQLGSGLTARLPTHSSYVAAVDKEHRWLPVLGPQLPVEIPEAVAKGAPGEGYPYPWAIRRWIPGETATVETITDLDDFARSIAAFILALQDIDATDGPLAGAHSFHRGAPPEYYHDETMEALAVLKGRIDTELAREVSETAIVFQNTSILSGLEDGVFIMMDRRNGRYFATAVRMQTVRHRGQCTKAPFSGFPDPPPR